MLNYSNFYCFIQVKIISEDYQTSNSDDYQTEMTPSILTIFGVLFNGVTGIMGKV